MNPRELLNKALQTALAVGGAGLFMASTAPAALADDHHHDPGADPHDGGGLHFTHPLISESPSPDTKIRLDTFYEDSSEGEELTLRLEAEYAFHRSFSIELDVPYTSVDPQDGGGVSDLGNVGVGLKFANFAFEDRGLLLGYGLELGLPTGDEGKGIGSDNILEIEPFLNLGYKRGAAEVVAFLEFGIPTNQDEGEEVETELGYNFSFLYHFSGRLQGLIELDGETVLSGEEDGETVVNLTPGVKFRPTRGSNWWIGLGLSVPMTSEEEFDTRGVVSGFYHF